MKIRIGQTPHSISNNSMTLSLPEVKSRKFWHSAVAAGIFVGLVSDVARGGSIGSLYGRGVQLIAATMAIEIVAELFNLLKNYSEVETVTVPFGNPQQIQMPGFKMTFEYNQRNGVETPVKEKVEPQVTNTDTDSIEQKEEFEGADSQIEQVEEQKSSEVEPSEEDAASVHDEGNENSIEGNSGDISYEEGTDA